MPAKPKKRSKPLYIRMWEALTKSVSGQELGARDFAYVGDPKDTSTWKLPVHDEAHAKDALARFSQTDGIPAADKPAVMKRIVAACKYYGVDPSGFMQEHGMKEDASGPLALSSEIALLREGTPPAGSPRGSVWDVTAIKAGESKKQYTINGQTRPIFYSESALSTSVPVFEGARVFANREGPHVDANRKSVHDQVAWLSNVAFQAGEITARLNVLPSATWLRENLLAAHDRGKKDLYELSIDASGSVNQREVQAGRPVFFVESIDYVDSVDIVPRGAAGGKFNRLIESFIFEGATAMKQKLALLFTLLYPAYLQENNVDWTKVNENELYTHLLEADKPQDRLHLPNGMTEAIIDSKIKELQEAFAKPAKKDPDPPHKTDPVQIDPKVAQKLTEDYTKMQTRMDEMQKQTCAAILRAKLTEANLPVPVTDKLRDQWKEKTFTEAEIDGSIKAERELLAKLFPTAFNSKGLDIRAGKDRIEKIQAALDGFFLTAGVGTEKARVRLGTDEAKKLLGDVAPFRSIKEAYIEITGDQYVTGRVDKQRKLTESIDTTQFATILADALNKRFVREYSMLNLDTWRPLVDIVPLTDFKPQHRIRMGGYGNLPAVAQSAPYVALTSPTDEEVVYQATKRGGTEDLTLESIKNDDIGFAQKIPVRMARAAAQTLHEFVYDFIRPGVNPTYDPDGLALYHATHVNIGATALTGTLATDLATIGAARLRMKQQTMAGSAKRLGIRGRYLIIPSDVETYAYQTLTPAFNKANMVPEFIQQVGIMPIVVDYWTDVNDFVLAADKGDVAGIEIGFLDGQENPELFVSDLPNVGTWFTNDVLTYKIRHIYGGDVIDFRAFDGTIAA